MTNAVLPPHQGEEPRHHLSRSGRLRTLTGVALFCLAPVRTAVGEDVDFSRDIRPLFAANCFACHGADENSREAELRLDVREQAVAPRDGAAAIVPGDSGRSEVYRRLTTEDENLRMPPPDSGHALTAPQIELIRRWIDAGAEYSQHWAFVKPQRPAPPAVKRAAWARNGVDAFILAKLEAAGLAPNAEADRHTLIRRLSLDLTGVPPTVEEVDAFVSDDSPHAYEALVDRLLASPRFAEHWARMWLDLARYADTKGYEKDQPREIWPYRDWVIAALHADMPFDQFTIEQLAGDLLPAPTANQILATAFHRNTMSNDEGGTDDEEFRVAAVKDRVDTTIQVWMGLTMGCAKCHSHKYDPITQHDYYRFFAIFNQTEDADRPNEMPRLPTPTPQQQARLDALNASIQQLRRRVKTQKPPSADAGGQEEPASADVAQDLAALEAEKTELQKQIPNTPILRELPNEKRRTTKIHVRGNFLEPGEEVRPALPAAFGEFSKGAPHSRLGVAQWLIHPDNPLTARVMVNRLWARIFGVGLVETEEDFGIQGTPPSHPELLDWLALEFRETHRWSIKQTLKTIVMSAAYRQSSQIDSQKRAIDPANRLLSRSPRFRLPAEVVRDQALAAAGLLSSKVGGPSVMPPQPSGIWRTTYSTLRWETSRGEDRYRRALYTFLRRTSPYPSMLTFDAGSGEVCLIRRVRTNTPLQALVTLNDPVYVEAAGALAKRVLTQAAAEKNAGSRALAAIAFRRVLVRPPSEAETDRLIVMYNQALTEYRDHPDSAAELLKAANIDAPPNVSPAELAAWTVVGNVLLNLDETVMRN